MRNGEAEPEMSTDIPSLHFMSRATDWVNGVGDSHSCVADAKAKDINKETERRRDLRRL